MFKNTLQLLKPNDKSINICENKKYMKIRKFKNKLLAFEVIRDYIYFESNKNKPLKFQDLSNSAKMIPRAKFITFKGLNYKKGPEVSDLFFNY